MGWGNYLVITKDLDLLMRYIEDTLKEDGVSEACRLRQIRTVSAWRSWAATAA